MSRFTQLIADSLNDSIVYARLGVTTVGVATPLKEGDYAEVTVDVKFFSVLGSVLSRFILRQTLGAAVQKAKYSYRFHTIRRFDRPYSDGKVIFRLAFDVPVTELVGLPVIIQRQLKSVPASTICYNAAYIDRSALAAGRLDPIAS
jgi:hypothetical protein